MGTVVKLEGGGGGGGCGEEREGCVNVGNRREMKDGGEIEDSEKEKGEID